MPLHKKLVTKSNKRKMVFYVKKRRVKSGPALNDLEDSSYMKAERKNDAIIYCVELCR